MMSQKSPVSSPAWMGRCLAAAGIYNLLWGGLTVLYPGWLFELTGMTPPNYPFIWQCVGMIVGVYGIGYLAAARDPLRHWPIVLVGFLGKIFGPLGYAMGVIQGDVPVAFGVTLPTNDLVWWVPFAAILYQAFRANTDTAAGVVHELRTELEAARTQAGESVAALSRRGPVLLLLVRHTGCVFCREALADLAAALGRIEKEGVRAVLVHQGSDEDIRPLLARYGIERIDRVSDPEKRLYRVLELQRGTMAQLFGPAVWAAGLRGLLGGHGIGRLVGDGFQMPGVFLIRDERVIAAHRHRHAAERPDYAGLACGTRQQGRALAS